MTRCSYRVAYDSSQQTWQSHRLMEAIMATRSNMCKTQAAILFMMVATRTHVRETSVAHQQESDIILGLL